MGVWNIVYKKIKEKKILNNGKKASKEGVLKCSLTPRRPDQFPATLSAVAVAVVLRRKYRERRRRRRKRFPPVLPLLNVTQFHLQRKLQYRLITAPATLTSPAPVFLPGRRPEPGHEPIGATRRRLRFRQNPVFSFIWTGFGSACYDFTKQNDVAGDGAVKISCGKLKFGAFHNGNNN